MKTELLVQMDGLLTKSGNVFLVAASNLPWDLDPAFLRRMEKRILIPLPNHECRKEMIRSHLAEFSPALRRGELLDTATALTEDFSGSDIKSLCKEAAMRPLRRVLAQAAAVDGPADREQVSSLVKKNMVSATDLHEAIATARRSAGAELTARYKQWEESYGSI